MRRSVSAGLSVSGGPQEAMREATSAPAGSRSRTDIGARRKPCLLKGFDSRDTPESRAGAIRFRVGTVPDNTLFWKLSEQTLVLVRVHDLTETCWSRPFE